MDQTDLCMRDCCSCQAGVLISFETGNWPPVHWPFFFGILYETSIVNKQFDNRDR